MIGTFTFAETSGAVAGTTFSSQSVQNAASYLAAGIAGPLDDFDAVDVTADLVGATGGTLDVYLQTSNDGSSWYDSVHFAQLAAGAAAVSYRVTLARFGQPASAAPVVVGKNGTPALAAGTAVQSFGTRARLVMVAGSGTSAAAKVAVMVAGSRTGKTTY